MDAVQKQAKDREEKQNEQMIVELQRSEDIAEGKELVEVPPGAKTIIVAKHYRNTSDYMTDYYSTTVEEVVYLAWSNHDKNNMAELKAAAKRFEATKDFLTAMSSRRTPTMPVTNYLPTSSVQIAGRDGKSPRRSTTRSPTRKRWKISTSPRHRKVPRQ